MKYDVHLVERCLEGLEDHGYEEPIIAFPTREYECYRRLIAEGLIISSGESRDHQYVHGLTLKGQEKLAALRQEHRWPKLKRFGVQILAVVLGGGIVQAVAIAWSYWFG